MKIQHTDGCMYDSLTIDGVETVDMDINKVKEVIKSLIDREDDLGALQQMLFIIVDSRGDCKDLGRCEECGDYVVEYTLEVPNE